MSHLSRHSVHSDDMPPPQLAATALEPFNLPSADVILRTSDLVDFHVHKLILSLASGFFKDMFTLPQPSASDESPPVIDIVEDSKTLDHLLRLTYPVEHPLLEDVMTLGAVLKAALKYQMDVLAARLRRNLSAFSDPLRVFTIACECELEEEAQQAALEWCELSDNSISSSYVEEMDGIRAGTYYRLLQFWSAYQRGHILPEGYRFCIPMTQSTIDHQNMDISPAFDIPPPFNERSSHSDIIIHSSDDTNIYANRSVTELASRKLASMIDESQKSNCFSPEGLVIIKLPESGHILLLLLQLSYPVTCPNLEDWTTLTTVLEAAERLEMPRAAELAKNKWTSQIKAYPLQSYFVAVRNGWENEARIAAKHASLISVDEYVPEMETASARHYRRFLEYRQKCRSVVVELRREIVEESFLMEEVYDLLWSDRDLKELLDYKVHCAWVLCGSVPSTVPPPRWQSPFASQSVSLGGAWPVIMMQLFACIDAWGSSSHFTDLIWENDKYGGEAVVALDQINLEL